MIRRFISARAAQAWVKALPKSERLKWWPLEGASGKALTDGRWTAKVAPSHNIPSRDISRDAGTAYARVCWPTRPWTD